MSYLRFILKNRRFLAYGFVAAFFSSFGQTFFVSVFNTDFKEAFNLDDFDIGLLYGSATLLGAAFMIPLGRRLDTSDLGRFTVAISIFLILACFLASSISSVVLLWLAYFALRLAGQGLFGATSGTTMARYFSEHRGKAIVVAAAAYPIGKALLPSVAVELKDEYGWQQTWLFFAIALACVAIPLLLWLLKGHVRRHQAWVVELDRAQGEKVAASAQKQLSRRDMLRDINFYRILPIVLGPPFLGTGMFFHIEAIGDGKGWSLEWMTLCYVGLSVSWIAMLFVGGALVDRFTARRLLPIFLVPFALALLLVGLFSHPYAAALAMVLTGFTLGLNRPVSGAIWAELYGVKNLGSIKALSGALMQVSTAVAPALLGWFLSAGMSVDNAALLGFGYIVVATLLVLNVRTVT